MSDLQDLITQHSAISRELVQQLRELGDMRAKLIRGQAHTWFHGADLGVTERREAVRYASADLAAEIENQVAEVDTLRVQLDDVKTLIKYTEDLARGLS